VTGLITVPKILVVDDDVNICEFIRLYLEKELYDVRTVYNGIAALNEFKIYQPNIVILDIMLPELDGWGVCREIRKISNTPIIMLTAKNDTFDKVLGLELGADDFIVKPFETKELLARIKAVLRRTGLVPQDSKEVSYPDLMIDKSSFRVEIDGNETDMTPKELELLFYLASNPNKVYTRDQLLEQVWSGDYAGDSRTVDVHIKRLREKTETIPHSWQIKTVWGVGYKFEVK
jgi:two-component system OmpR family response regulator